MIYIFMMTIFQVVKLDGQKKKVWLNDGTEILYEKCLLATGNYLIITVNQLSLASYYFILCSTYFKIDRDYELLLFGL